MIKFNPNIYKFGFVGGLDRPAPTDDPEIYPYINPKYTTHIYKNALDQLAKGVFFSYSNRSMAAINRARVSLSSSILDSILKSIKEATTMGKPILAMEDRMSSIG